MKRRTVGLVFLLGLLAYVLTGVYPIRPDERAVVKRFGQVAARPGPGLWVGLPWGLDRLERVSIAQVQRVTVGYQPDLEVNPQAVPEGLLLTGDENLVNLRINVDFAVAEGDTSLDDYVMHRRQISGVIARETDSLAAEWASGQAIDSVLLAGSAELPRWLTLRLQSRIEPYRLGVRIHNASVALLTPPDDVKRDFERVNQAEAVNRTRVSRARQEESQRRREAESAAYRMSQEAKAYQETSQALAETEAGAFLRRVAQYHELRQGRHDILGLIWWDEMSKVFFDLKQRGRIEVLDQYLGPDGLDLSQIVPPGKRKVGGEKGSGVVSAPSTSSSPWHE